MAFPFSRPTNGKASSNSSGSDRSASTYRPDSEAAAQSRRDLLVQVDELLRENKQLATQALIDTLTNLPNRRALDEALAVMDEQARAGGGTYDVAYLDVDHFHDLNRAFDDVVGDAALRTTLRRSRTPAGPATSFTARAARNSSLSSPAPTSRHPGGS